MFQLILRLYACKFLANPSATDPNFSGMYVGCVSVGAECSVRHSHRHTSFLNHN